MIFRKKKKPTKKLPTPTIDTIIIIGNGFDRWQGLNTSYADFQTYYHEHLNEILKKTSYQKAQVYQFRRYGQRMLGCRIDLWRSI